MSDSITVEMFCGRQLTHIEDASLWCDDAEAFVFDGQEMLLDEIAFTDGEHEVDIDNLVEGLVDDGYSAVGYQSFDGHRTGCHEVILSRGADDMQYMIVPNISVAYKILK